MGFSFLEGNEAIAYGALAAGCKFFAGYPITPATTIYQTMLRLLPAHGGYCLQGEDEISSIGFCLGASMAGLRAMTATSGPGISLMSEHISFAIGSEIPVVIVDVQRLGPSTGSATKGADGDIQFLRWGSSGGLPVVVLAPATVADCYTMCIQAFSIAERYRCPVFIASNKEIGMTRESVDLTRLEEIEQTSGNLSESDSPDFQDNSVLPDGVLPFSPIGTTRLVRQTSSTHGPDGYITTDPEQIHATIQRLQGKLQKAAPDLCTFALDPQPQSECLLITYGVTSRAAQEAVLNARNRGMRVTHLVLKTLYPVPETLLQEAIAQVDRVIVIEMNCGQYVREIERLSGTRPVSFFGRMDGELISPETIGEVLEPCRAS